MSEWTPDSWRNRKACQLPEYTDTKLLAAIEQTLSNHPPLVFNDEIRALTNDLANVANGKAFLLQGGSCAETFAEVDGQYCQSLFTLMMQMSVALTFGAGLPVVKVGRIAGQYAKPRSSATETREDTILPVYRGDIINGYHFDTNLRQPDPQRMLKACQLSASTLNQLRAVAYSDHVSLDQAHKRNQDYVNSAPELSIFQPLAKEISASFDFMKACNYPSVAQDTHRSLPLYTSHEALLLPYEQALTRMEPETGQWFNNSAHMLWIGDRTRQLDGAHIEFIRGISNPVGLKAGPGITEDDLLKLIHRINPDNSPGKINIITRMGATDVEKHLPRLVQAVTSEGYNVIWSCDPMHGNTFTSSTGHKTRHLDAILTEIKAFFAIHHALDSYAGGIHLEMTGEPVTECLGGKKVIRKQHLNSNYQTLCDPRLNGNQALELAFEMVEVFREIKRNALAA